MAIEEGNFDPPREVHHTHEGSIGNLKNDQIREMMNQTLAGFNFEKVQNAIQKLVKD